MVAIQKSEKRIYSQIGFFIVLLFGGLLVFMPTITFAAEMSPQTATFVRAGTAVSLLLLTGFMRYHQRLQHYWPIPFALFAASLALLVTWVFSDWLLHLFNLSLESAAGLAIAKLSDALPVVITLLVINKAFGFDLGSIFIRKGNLRRGLAIGLSGFVAFTIVALFQAMSQGLEIAQIVPVIPWILLFVLVNGFMEELLFRGLFLKRYEPVIGSGLANLVTALVFTVVHLQAGYVDGLWSFLALVFLLALTWGQLMFKTDSLIGSTLFHAGADMLIIVGIFATYGVGF